MFSNKLEIRISSLNNINNVKQLIILQYQTSLSDNSSTCFMAGKQDNSGYHKAQFSHSEVTTIKIHLF